MKDLKKLLEERLGKKSWECSAISSKIRGLLDHGDYLKSFEVFEYSLIFSNLDYAFFFANANEEDFHSAVRCMDEYSKLNGFDTIEELESSNSLLNAIAIREYSNSDDLRSNIGMCIFKRPHHLRIIYSDAHDLT